MGRVRIDGYVAIRTLRASRRAGPGRSEIDIRSCGNRRDEICTRTYSARRERYVFRERHAASRRSRVSGNGNRNNKREIILPRAHAPA